MSGHDLGKIKEVPRSIERPRAFTRHSFWVRHSKILALGPIGLGTVRLIYTAKYVRVFSMLISGTAPLKQERKSKDRPTRTPNVVFVVASHYQSL